MNGGMLRTRVERGFTIVELLIVIIVIAILAAITIVAFNGIQQRSKNAAKIATVDQVSKLIHLYRAENDEYPRNGGGIWCLTQDNLCTSYNGTVITSDNTSLMDDLRRSGNPPISSGDKAGSGSRYGIQYIYSSAHTLSSRPNPVLIIYWLDGTNQMCAGTIGGMISVTDGGSANNFVPADRSNGNSSGRTRCYLMFAN